jgi:hypothetical protein
MAFEGVGGAYRVLWFARRVGGPEKKPRDVRAWRVLTVNDDRDVKGSVLVGEHDREDARGLCRIFRVVRDMWTRCA